MRAKALEQILHTLGRAYLLGLFLQVRIDDRSVLIPCFAAACTYLLVGLRRTSVLAISRWFDVALGCAALVTVGGVVAWFPVVEAGAAGAALSIVITIGSAAYGATLVDVSVRQSWDDAAATARRAVLGNVIALGSMVLGCAVLLLLVDAGAPDPGSGVSPSVVLDRPMDRIGTSIGLVLVILIWIGAAWLLRKANRAVRDELSKDPERQLVEA